MSKVEVLAVDGDTEMVESVETLSANDQALAEALNRVSSSYIYLKTEQPVVVDTAKYDVENKPKFWVFAEGMEPASMGEVNPSPMNMDNQLFSIQPTGEVDGNALEYEVVFNSEYEGAATSTIIELVDMMRKTLTLQICVKKK